MNSPKEFWITKTEHNDIVVYEKNPVHEYATIHVIKYSEYESLQKENTELKSEVEYLNRTIADKVSGCCDCSMFKTAMKHQDELKSEIESLKLTLSGQNVKLDKCVEVLKFYSSHSSWEWYVTCQEYENLHILKEDCEDFISTEKDSDGEEYQVLKGSFGGRLARQCLQEIGVE
jgi:hypothetical protein